MKYRKLGRTGLDVSEIALGCSGFWGNRLFPDDRAIAIVCEAFERGVNLFDTGHNYSNYNAEPRLGRAIEKLLATTNRSRLVISTKAGTVKRALLERSNNKRTDFSPDYIESACAQAIKNLRCGYLDIFQLHGITASEVTDALLERLSAMKRRGVFRYLGVNTHRESDMIFVSKHPETFDVVLIDFNVLQLDRIPVIRRLHEAGIGVMAGTVLAQGHLFGRKIGSFRSSADIWYFARAMLRPPARRLGKAAQTMRNTLAGLSDMTPPQAALAFALESAPIASCVVGTTELSHIKELVEASERQLSEDSKAAIWESFKLQSQNISG